MVENLNTFTVTIICTVMMMMLIKMIIPEGKNKKYILFICGLITTLVLLEPMLSFLNIDINEVLAKNEFEYQEYKADDSLYQEAVRASYEEAMINDVISRLKENGYNVSHVRIEYDEVTYKPMKIYLKLEDEEGFVQPIKIEVSNNQKNATISEVTKSKIQKMIEANYGISKSNILIERSS